MTSNMANINKIATKKWKRRKEARQDTVVGRRGGVGGVGQFIEVKMTVKNRWDEPAEECFVGGML